MYLPLFDKFGYLAKKIFAQKVIKGTYVALTGISEYSPSSIQCLDEIDLNLNPGINQSGQKK